MGNINFAKARLGININPNRPKFFKNSRTPDILAMLDQGLPHRQIADKVGCSVSHVSNMANRHRSGSKHFKIPPLLDEHYVELWKQAEELEVSAGELARAYIIDGINDNKGKNGDPHD